MADDRTYIRVHDGMPGHPKVRGLSDKAFRTLIRAWCYSSEYLTDGEVVVVVARDLGTTRAWTELVSAGLAESAPGGYLLHDYLEHQRSAAEVAEIKAGRGAGGNFGNHIKWHVKRRKPNPECEHCQRGVDIANGSQERYEGESESDRPPSHRSETETEAETKELLVKTSLGNATEVTARDPNEPPKCRQHKGMLRANVPDCLGCERKRKQWEFSRAADAEFGGDPWCGDDECNPITRKRTTPFGDILCPECHPLADQIEAS